MVDTKQDTTQNVVGKRIQWDDLDPKKYYFFNGLLGGSIDLMMYPLDVIRTRLQVQGSISIQQKFPHYTGTFDGLKKLYTNEGFKGYYKGFLTSEVGYLSSRAIYFGTYEVLKQSFQKFTNQSHLDESSEQLFMITTISGGIAEMFATLIWVPFDVATQTVQIQDPKNPEYRPGLHVFKKIYQERGFTGLYRGFGATMIKNVPFSGIWWGTYELTKKKVEQLNIREKLNIRERTNKTLSVSDGKPHQVQDEDPITHLISGFAAAVISTTITNPLDVAKTRLQTGTFEKGQKVNFISVIKDTVRKEGVRALWKGLVPSLLTSTPYSMMSIILYEEVKKLSLK
ncbi:hypothetical protein CYY_001306 [Polysphondylium violaceum]|uniref:Mitochondrial substrate carrier family protein n=1 Tax=Polysphondylium violaceum TaxID=133409 RepID=A0A8J4Q015_9MYCE|nr:hypothetical protein CYY_001306 [Polysphondylium violaceum]